MGLLGRQTNSIFFGSAGTVSDVSLKILYLKWGQEAVGTSTRTF